MRQPTEALTPAERKVLGLAQRGFTNPQIARELGITENAVRYHLKELHSKLETHSDREVLNSRRWSLSALLLLVKQHAASAGIAAGVGAVSLGGYLAVQYAHESNADSANESGSSSATYCVAELRPTVVAGAAPASAGEAERCFNTPEEVQAFYQTLR